MNILFVTHQYFPDHVGGTEIYTHGLARRVMKDLGNVAVFTYIESAENKQDKFIIKKTIFEEVPVHQVHYNLSVDPYPALAEYKNEFIKEKFSVLLDELKPDVVHVTHAMKISGSILEACFEAGVPYIVTLTDFWFICPRHTLLKWNGEICDGPKSRLYCARCLHETHGFFSNEVMKLPTWLFHLKVRYNQLFNQKRESQGVRDARAQQDRNSYLNGLLEKAAKVISLSSFQGRVMIKNGLSGKNMEIIHHGLEIDGLRKRSRPGKGQTTFIYIGSIVPHKGLDIALKAFKMFGSPDIQIKVFGNIDDQNEYGKLIQQLADDDSRVSLEGTFHFSRLGEILETADVLVMPSIWYENEPLVVKAALYTGLPVLASRIGSLPEMIAEGKTGWLVPPGDHNAWKVAIEIAEKNHLPPGTESHYKVFSADEHYELIKKLYEKVIV